MVSSAYYPRLLQAPQSSFFLFGARGSGKSTWAHRLFPDAHSFDLLDEELFHSLLLDSGQFAAELRTVAPGSWVIVDEIQRIPSLLNEVHRFLENAGLRFVLLGSSARKLKTAQTNLLAGRALHKTLYPFTPEELGGDFRLEDVLRYGSLPLVWGAQTKRETLQAYIQLYVREEIRAESLVRNLPGFTRFLPLRHSSTDRRLMCRAWLGMQVSPGPLPVDTSIFSKIPYSHSGCLRLRQSSECVNGSIQNSTGLIQVLSGP